MNKTGVVRQTDLQTKIHLRISGKLVTQIPDRLIQIRNIQWRIQCIRRPLLTLSPRLQQLPRLSRNAWVGHQQSSGMPGAGVVNRCSLMSIFHHAENTIVESVKIQNRIKLAAQCHHIIQRHQLLRLLIPRHGQSHVTDGPSLERRQGLKLTCQHLLRFPGKPPRDGSSGDPHNKLLRRFFNDRRGVVPKSERIGLNVPTTHLVRNTQLRIVDPTQIRMNRLGGAVTGKCTCRHRLLSLLQDIQVSLRQHHPQKHAGNQLTGNQHDCQQSNSKQPALAT